MIKLNRIISIPTNLPNLIDSYNKGPQYSTILQRRTLELNEDIQHICANKERYIVEETDLRTYQIYNEQKTYYITVDNKIQEEPYYFDPSQEGPILGTMCYTWKVYPKELDRSVQQLVARRKGKDLFYDIINSDGKVTVDMDFFKREFSRYHDRGDNELSISLDKFGYVSIEGKDSQGVHQEVRLNRWAFPRVSK